MQARRRQHEACSAICLDAAALALLSPRQLVWLLCAAMSHERSRMVQWLEDTMSDLATELFTDNLECPRHEAITNDDAGGYIASGDIAMCPLGREGLCPFAASVETQLQETASQNLENESAVDVPNKQISGFGGDIEDLFDRVYAALDSERLLQKLEYRKQRWRDAMLAEIRNDLV